MKWLSKSCRYEWNLSVRLSQSSYDRLLSQTTVSLVFYHQKVVKTEMLKLFGLSANKIYQAPSLKVAISIRCTKRAMTDSFRRAHFP